MQLDTTKPGQHTIDCVATDQAGNTATSTITRTIMVAAPANDNPPPAAATGTEPTSTTQ